MNAIIEQADVSLARMLWSIYINTDFAAAMAKDEIHKQATEAIYGQLSN